MDFVAPLLIWIETHPTWAGLLVAFIAFAESLALVGLFLPGAAMMFGIGALVGSGTLALWPTLAWAAAGAIAGDGVSFWLGRRFHGQLRALWPFRTHPELIENATAFFERHGGKSVLFGRFVGPIRPVIPAVAGMMDMPTARFFAVNIISGIFWAPVYVLPGMVFAATLGLAAEIATRLAVMGGLLLGLVVVVLWLIHRLFIWFHPRTHAMIAAALTWSDRHPVAGRVPAALLDPDHPEARSLTLLAFVLVGAFAVFVTVIEALGAGGLLASIDGYVYESLQDLRTPPMDQLMVAITELGDGEVLVAVSAVVLAWLGGRRHWQAAAHFLAAGLFAAVASRSLKWFFEVARPAEIYDGIVAFSFPSGHATHSMAVYGFLAVLVARELPGRSRWLAYAVPGVLITAIGFSRLYLGAHWLSDVIAGLSLSLAWVALLGIAYRRHPAGRLSPGGLTLVAALGIALAGGLNITLQHQTDRVRYTPAREIRQLDSQAWWTDQWQTLPAYRAELRPQQSHPLDVQYAGPLTALRGELLNAGWQAPPELNALTWMYWLDSRAALSAVPVLPQVHAGSTEALVVTRTLPARGEVLALRLWPSNVELKPNGQALWIGNVTRLRRSDLPGMTIPRTAAGFDAPLQVLADDLANDHARLVKREVADANWSGDVLLIRSSE